MRLHAVLVVFVFACGNDPDPRLIPGGGVGDGAIDGKVNVYVIDNFTGDPIANATVTVGSKDATSDATGLVFFEDVSGSQTIAVDAGGYRATVWADVDGANVTIPITALTAVPDQASLSGTITGWDAITVAPQHFKAAVVLYSQVDRLGDDANNIATPNMANICGITGTACNFTVRTRAGAVTLVAAIIDRDTKGTAAGDDDTTTLIGWAYAAGLTVMNGVDQSGLQLQMVEAGNIQNVTVDLGTPPAGLPDTQVLVGIELPDEQVVQLPAFLATDQTSFALPAPTVFDRAATYRLTAVAQTTSGETGAQSIVLRQGLTGTALAAGEWLVPPTSVSATRSTALLDPVAGAKATQVEWSDATGVILEITDFDASKANVDVPPAVALPTSGTLTAKVSGLGADFDVRDFSLDDDRKLLWGVAAQPATVP